MKQVVKVGNDIPLIGAIMFGVIDRGTNLIQVRPTTVCNLNCLFCSVDSGAKSKTRQCNYIVDLDHLLNWVEKITEFKGEIEANIDSVGELTTYPDLLELVEGISKIENVKKISMQTNGVLLDVQMIKKLEKAGLNQINLSINSFDKKLAKELAGCEYNIEKIIELAKAINESKIDLLIAPLWIPNINDEEIIKIIKFCKELGCKIGIQKYETYKYSRRMKKAKKINYWKFYNQLQEWEKQFGVKLIVSAQDFNIEKRERIPKPFKKGDKVRCGVKLPGWLKNQVIGVAKNRCITINNCNSKMGQEVMVKIVEDKNSIFIAEK